MKPSNPHLRIPDGGTTRPPSRSWSGWGRLAGAALLVGVVLALSVPASAQDRFPISSAQTLERGKRYASESGNHFLVLNPDGNLVVARADGGYVWGFDTLPAIDHTRVGRVDWQADGNLAAYDAAGGYLWSALTQNADPASRLVLSPGGALQIISPSRGILWASDGNLRAAAAPAPPRTAAPAPTPRAATPAAPTAVASPGATGSGFPFTAGQTIAKGSTFNSPSGGHKLVFQDGGNLVVTKSDGGYMWGFDQVRGLNFRQVDRVAVQPDGNFVALNAAGTPIWRAVASNPDPASRLELNARGALQLVSPSRGVLWASDGVLLADGVAGSGFPFTAGQTVPQGQAFASPSGQHVLTFQDSGNLVVASPGGSFVWGFNGVQGLNFRDVRRVQMSADGNLVALNSSGTPIWKAVASNPDPASRLELSYGGALQVVSPSRGILWSSDGILTPAIRIATAASNASRCEPEAGWAKCLQMGSPTMKIQGTSRVSDTAMNMAANVYTELTKRFKPAFPASTFDGFRVYMTNGESEAELTTLPTVGSMWTSGYGPRSRATLRGGASNDYLWISEQMICKEGVATRNQDFAAGRVPTEDHTYRSVDQVIHEFGHSIDSRFGLMNTRLRSAYRGDPTEQFPQGIQAWFGAPFRDITGTEQALLNDLFSSRAVFSCEGYTP